MNKILDNSFTGEKLYCDCIRKTKLGALIDGWSIAQRDEKITETPDIPKIIEIHRCPKIIVWQEYMGLKRYYLINENK